MPGLRQESRLSEIEARRMRTKEVRALECAALASHRRGDRWTQFWECHGREVCRAEPVNRQRFARLVRRLLSLVTSGDTANMEPVGSALEPWEHDDDEHEPADVGTRARCLLLLLAIPGVTIADRLEATR